MNFVVTGGAGFIGSHLVDKLLSEGNHVICIDDLSSGYLSNLPENNNLSVWQVAIQDTKIDELPEIDGIFHLAAQASVPVSIENLYASSVNNLASSIYVLEMAKALSIPVVYASSSAIYGNLEIGDDEKIEFDILSPYALDKLTLENYAKLCCQIYGVSSIGLRFFNVYGPRQDPTNPYSGVISVFIDKFIQKQAVQINGGYQTRDFIYVRDIIKVLMLSMDKVRSTTLCEVFNVGTGIEITIDDLYENLTEIFKYKPKILRMSLPTGDPERSSGNYKKLINEYHLDLNDFTHIKVGLKETVNYFKNHCIQV
jgi:UDP-glucose 4-epimerase